MQASGETVRTRARTVARRSRTTTALALILGAQATTGHAGPQGGVVIDGAADISRSGSTTSIRQETKRAIIDWDSFDIGRDETVNFDQPSARAVALNRAHSATPTQIEGALNAPGNVWVLNRNGVMVSDTARISVGGFVATTADIEDSAFMAGDYRFDRPGDPNAQVVNEGRITFGEAGLVGLVGPTARNDGVVAGRLGRVVVAGTDAFAVDLAGDGILALPTGAAPDLAAENTGTISNAGGHVLVDAATAEGVLESTVFAGGDIEATSFEASEGRIVLSSGDRVEIAGTLDASGAAGAAGGEVTVTGERLALTETARVDVSGEAGGGRIRIGGDVQGGGALPRARTTTVAAGAELDASAEAVGDGGSVVLWSDEATRFSGSISARGGPGGGDGGFAEISSSYLEVQGDVDLSAPAGVAGELLLDPNRIVVADFMEGADEGPGEDISFNEPGSTTTITPDFITSVDGSLTLQAVEDIWIRSEVDNRTTGNTLDLSLEAGHGIQVDASMFIEGSISFDADAGPFEPPATEIPALSPGVRVGSNLTVSTSGPLNFNVGAGEELTLRGGTSLVSGGGLELPETLLEAGTELPISIEVSGGDLTQEAGSAITEAVLTETGSGGAFLSLDTGLNDIFLPSKGNDFTELSAIGNDITIGHSGQSSNVFSGLTTRGVFATGDLVMDVDGRLTLGDVDGDVSGETDVSAGGNASFSAKGRIFAPFDATLSIAGDSVFRATDDLGDADPANDLFFDILLREPGAPSDFGGTVSLVGDTVFIDSDQTLTITDSYAADYFEAESFSGDVNVTRLFTGFSGQQQVPQLLADGGLALEFGGDVRLESDAGSISVTDLFAANVELTGNVTLDEFESDVFGPILGDVTVDDFEATTLTIAPVLGDLALSDGSVDTLAFDSAANMSLTSVDIIGPDPLDFPAGTIGAGGTLTLNGVRGTALTGEVPNLALGFLEVGSIDISSPGDIVKVPDSDLPAGDGGDVLLDAPEQAATGVDLADRIVSSGAAFANLIHVDGSTVFNGGLAPGTEAGDILLPHGEAGGVAFHNDFAGTFAADTAANVAVEDENSLDIDVTIAGDLSARADSDGTGNDGAITGSFLDIGGTGTFLTTGDITLSGTFGGLQMVGANADVSSFSDLPVANSRLSGDMFLTLVTSTGTGELSVSDSEVGGELSLFSGVFPFEGPATDGNIEVTRTAVGGPLDAEAMGSVALTDLQVGADATIRTTEATATRAAIGGDLGFDAPSGGALTTVAMTDTAVDGALSATAAQDITAARLRVGGTATLNSDGSVELSDFAVGGGDFLAPAIALADGRVGSALTFADGTVLSLTDLEVLGALDTGLADQLTLSGVSADGDLTVATTGALVADDLSATGAGSFSGASYDLTAVDIAGLASFADSSSLAISDGAFGGLDFGASTQGVVTGERIVVSNDLTGASDSSVAFTDLRVGGNTILSAATDLTLRRFSIEGFALGAAGALSLEDGVAASRLTAAEVGTGQGSELMAALATPATANLRNLELDALRLGTIGTARLSGVRTAGEMSLDSATGDVLLGQIDAGTLSVDAPEGAILTRDATDDAFFAEGFADFTILGPEAPMLRGALAALADIAGPGAGTAAVIGQDTGAALGDSVAAGRVTETVGPVAGAAGAPGIAAAGSPAPAGDLTVPIATPSQPTGVAVSGTTRLTAGGDVRLARTNLSAPQPSRNFFGGPVLTDSGGDVLIEAADLSNGVAVTSTGSAELVSDGGILLGPTQIGGDLAMLADADAGSAGFGDGAIEDRPLTVDGETLAGPVVVLGALTISQGGGFDLLSGDDLDALLSQVAGLNRDVTLDNPGNTFGPSARISDVTGDVTLVEEQTGTDDTTDGGLLAFEGAGGGAPGLEALGSIAVVTPDGVELRDDVTLAGGESLSIDTSSGGGAILFLGALQGTGGGTPPDVTLVSGSGDVSFLGLVGIAADGTERRLGTVRIGPAGDVLVSGVEPEDGNVFVADRLELTGVTGDVLMNVPAALEERFTAQDFFFGVDLGALDFSEAPEIRSMDLFGSIAGNATVEAGLLPVGEPSPTRFFNGCLIGDPESCASRPDIPIGQIVEDELLEDEIAFVAPFFETEDPVFELPGVDFSTLYSATGNENLWTRSPGAGNE